MAPFGRAPTAKMCSCKGHPVACWYTLTAWEFNNEESDLITLLSAGRLPSIPSWGAGGGDQEKDFWEGVCWGGESQNYISNVNFRLFASHTQGQRNDPILQPLKSF